MELTIGDFAHLGLCLEGFFYGLYSGIFVLYLQCHASDKKKRNIIFYAICVLYVSCLATFVFDITSNTIVLKANVTPLPPSLAYRLNVTDITITSSCDFISQSILIYRCWIVWGRNIRVVIIPSILALAFLAIWLSSIGATEILHGKFMAADWVNTLIVTWQDNTWIVTSLAMSMTVNALVTGLIVLRIFKVFVEVKAAMTSDEQNLGPTGGRKLQTIIFVLIESGMALFSTQLARLVVTFLNTDAALNAFEIISPMHEMIIGITPTIILVRVSMGLSFDDEASMVEAASSFCFAPNDPNLIPGSISSVHQEGREDGVDVQPSDDIQMVNVETTIAP